MVEWRPVPRWEGLYEVSNEGQIRSLDRTRERICRGRRQIVFYPSKVLKMPLRNGYPLVHLSEGERNECIYVHRAVCEAFYGPAPEGQEVAHGDGSTTNNRAENLRWATRSENMLDKRLHGTVTDRDNHPRAKIRSSDLAVILRRIDAGDRNMDVERDYGLAEGYVSRIRRRFRPHTLRGKRRLQVAA